jgi:hypothetical protein
MANETRTNANPPYGPWNSFTGFIKELSESVVPPNIDGTLFRGKSGTTQSELRGALRFFGMVEGEKNSTTPRLHALVEASKDKEAWKQALAEVVPEAYAEILEGVDLVSGTRGQLEEAFRERGGVTGSVNRKAVRFYLSGITEAGLTVSPHFGADKARASPGSRQNGGRKSSARARQQKTATVVEDNPGKTPAPPEGVETVTCSIPGGRTIQVIVPSDLTNGEERFLLTYLQGYFDLKGNGEK